MGKNTTEVEQVAAWLFRETRAKRSMERYRADIKEGKGIKKRKETKI